MQPNRVLAFALACGVCGVLTQAADLKSAVESPEAATIVKNDLLPAAKTYTMPADCISTDPKRIAKAKVKTADGTVKQYGNCVACHKIEGAQGFGNIGPDLSNYHEYFIKTGTRDYKWVFQKVSDARIDNPTTNMTINLTSGTMNEQEVCDVVSYVVSKK